MRRCYTIIAIIILSYKTVIHMDKNTTSVNIWCLLPFLLLFMLNLTFKLLLVFFTEYKLQTITHTIQYNFFYIPSPKDCLNNSHYFKTQYYKHNNRL